MFEVRVKILLKRAGSKSSKKYHEEVAKIAKVTISAKSNASSNIEMVSAKELYSNGLLKPTEVKFRRGLDIK